MKELLTRTDISRMFRYGREKSDRIFRAAKSVDQDKFDLRPRQVPLECVVDVMGLSTRAMKRIIEQQEGL